MTRPTHRTAIRARQEEQGKQVERVTELPRRVENWPVCFAEMFEKRLMSLKKEFTGVPGWKIRQVAEQDVRAEVKRGYKK